MTDPMIDQIIPFHSNQSKAILEAKGISHYKNYKTFQTDKKLSDGTVGHQINLYTEVIREFERRGQPIKNKYDFVNAFLQVCKEKNLPCYLISGGNHSLETNEPMKDLTQLVRIMEATEKFLSEEL